MAGNYTHAAYEPTDGYHEVVPAWMKFLIDTLWKEDRAASGRGATRQALEVAGDGGSHSLQQVNAILPKALQIPGPIKVKTIDIVLLAPYGRVYPLILPPAPEHSGYDSGLAGLDSYYHVIREGVGI